MVAQSPARATGPGGGSNQKSVTIGVHGGYFARRTADLVEAHPTHRVMAAKIGLDAVLSLVEQRDTLAAAAAAPGSRWLPGAQLLTVDEPGDY